jgi:hypothetical protein
MSMHLVHPALTTTGKRRGKRKFRNAESARKAREMAENWRELKSRHEIEEVKKKRSLSAKPYKPPKLDYRGRDDPKIPSVETTMDPCLKAPEKVYTGNKILGIGTMHKSNAIPIFSNEQAKDISTMRR